MRIQEEKIELQKKVHGKICVRDITFLAVRSPVDVIFCRFFRLLQFYVEKIYPDYMCLVLLMLFKSINKRNSKRFNSRVYSLFFIMSIFLKHLWLIPNILKQQSRKIFTKLAPSPSPSRSSHRKCFVKKGVLKSFTGKRRCWSLF